MKAKALFVIGAVSVAAAIIFVSQYASLSSFTGQPKKTKTKSSDGLAVSRVSLRNSTDKRITWKLKTVADSISSKSQHMSGSTAASVPSSYFSHRASQLYWTSITGITEITRKGAEKGAYEKEADFRARITKLKDSRQRTINERLVRYVNSDSSLWTVETPVFNIGSYSPDYECAGTLGNSLIEATTGLIPYASGFITDESVGPVYTVKRGSMIVMLQASSFCYKVSLANAQKYDIARSQTNGMFESTFQIVLDSSVEAEWDEQIKTLRPVIKLVASRWFIGSDTIFHYADSLFIAKMTSR